MTNGDISDTVGREVEGEQKKSLENQKPVKRKGTGDLIGKIFFYGLGFGFSGALALGAYKWLSEGDSAEKYFKDTYRRVEREYADTNHDKNINAIEKRAFYEDVLKGKDVTYSRTESWFTWPKYASGDSKGKDVSFGDWARWLREYEAGKRTGK